jgi:hypothetical protein
MRAPHISIHLAALALLFLPAPISARPADRLASTSEYFPKESHIDPSRAAWYSMHLRQFNERPLEEAGTKAKCFRFQWVRSFHHPICITIHFRSKVSNRCIIEAKEKDQADTYPPRPASIIKDETYSLSLEQEKELLKQINGEKFWQTDSYDDLTMPVSMRIKTKSYPMMFDGAQWILEGWDHGKYHLVVRQSPRSGPVWNIGTMLLKLMNMFPDDPKEVY